LPQIWVGYLLGFATVIAETIAVSVHPELAKGPAVPPLYLFLPDFTGGVYWFVCVYRFHQVMNHTAGWQHPISPARGVGFHFIPLYNLYWIFVWPQPIAAFVNSRLGKRIMRPGAVGFSVLLALVIRIFVDPGLGLILLFLSASYLSVCIRRAGAQPAPGQAPAGPPFS
jgi:hypothetical protein